MANFGRNAPPIAVVLASLVLWVSFAWGLPAEAVEGEADVAPAEDTWRCGHCDAENVAAAKYCTKCGAKRLGEADVAPGDPWAGVKISDAYDYATCPTCGEKNQIGAAACSRCGNELVQATAGLAYPPWVFVPGKGYYREGTLLEPGKDGKGLWVKGLIITGIGLPIMIGGLVILTAGGDPVGIPLSIAGSGVTVVGSILIIKGFTTRTEAVYAFASGERYEPYERPAFARRPLDTDGVGLRVEVTVFGF